MAADEPTVIENWERMRILGSGGFGVVTLWKHKITSQLIAVKKCRYDLYPLMNPKQQERWEKEVEIMLRLEHQNVVKAMNVPDRVFEDALRKGAASLPLLCMEFCSRGDLRQVLNKAENCCGLRENEVRNLIRDVTSAVKYLHSLKITHRDLKPENIVLQEENNKIVYKLIDLGYAKELDQSSVCASFVGTLQYLAPELFMSQKYSCSVDYWSLGLVSHEVITGVRPFLPSMPPVTWMSRVQNKSAKDICAYQDYDGNIVFSTELFPQNHISQCLKYYMEQWLQFCLEWDSKLRGRAFTEGDESRVVVFAMLDEILAKKMVYVFSLPTYEVLSYEVEESTRMSTLQGWVERDTNIPVAKQEVLSVGSPGKSFDPDGPALMPEFFQADENERKREECYLFIFIRDSLETPQVTPSVPQLVERMLQEPRRLVEYPLQKRTWANAVFFLQQEASLYRHFLHAYKVKKLHMFALSSKLSMHWKRLYAEYQHLLSQYELFKQSLKLDQDSLKDHSSKMDVKSIFPSSITRAWFQNGEAIFKKISMLVQAVTLQEKKCAAIAAKISHFNSNPAPRDTPYNVLEPLVLSSQKCYEQLCRRPKESRYKKSDSVEMVKIVYGCLKERDKLLRDKAFQTHLGKVMELQLEMEQFIGFVLSSVEQTTKLKNQLWTTQAERQKDIWDVINSRPLNDLSATSCGSNFSWNLPMQSLTPNISSNIRYSFSDLDLKFQELSTTEENFDHKRPLSSYQSIREDDKVTDEANDMLNENYSLRTAMQDLMSEAYDKVRSVMCEQIGDFGI